MDDNTQLPPAPTAQAAPAPPVAAAAPRRSWRDRLPSGRTVAAGAVVAGLAVGGAGFGAGYAVGDDGASGGVSDTTQTTGDRGGFPGDGHGGPMGDMDGDGPMGQLPGGPMGGTTQDQGGTSGQAPDFDGDGQPDTDSDSGSTSDSSTQNG